MDNTKLAAEVVKLKQQVAELRAAIERVDESVGGLLKDHDGTCSPTLVPWPLEGTARELPEWYKRSMKRWMGY